METSSNSNNEPNVHYPITIKNSSSNSQLSLPPSYQSQSQKSSIKLAISKDERLEYLNIPKGLIELLKINDFTIEKILEYGPSKIAEILVIDNYVAQIIFNETNNKKY
ncbi:MAG TPA: hypothetical protein VIQ04_05490 [Nitrososphaeraceae archaeon]